MVLRKTGRTILLISRLKNSEKQNRQECKRFLAGFVLVEKNDEKELIGASRRLCRSLRLRVQDLPADEETLCSGCSAPERPADWAPCPDEALVYRDGKADCSRGGPELGADDLFVAWCCPVDGRGIDRRYTACRLHSNTARPIVLCELPDAGAADRRRRRHRSKHR